jgi:hypothetical protein
MLSLPKSRARLSSFQPPQVLFQHYQQQQQDYGLSLLSQPHQPRTVTPLLVHQRQKFKEQSPHQVQKIPSTVL